MTTSAHAKALANGKKACEVFKTIEKQAHNTSAYAHFASYRDKVNAGLQRKNWDDASIKEFSAAYDRLRYGLVILTKGDDALQYVHEKGIECDFHGRNRYGKQLNAIDRILGKTPQSYEQGAYMSRTWELLIQGDEIESDFTLTARELAYSIGAAKDKPIGQTQVYAVLQALELIGAGKRLMAGRGADWLASKIVLNPESDFVQALNKAIA